MKIRLTLIVLGALLLAILAATANAAEEKAVYRLGIIAITVTPEHVREKKIPFQFDLAPGDGATMNLSIFIGPATQEFGTPRDCRLVVSSLSLPADAKGDFRWAIDAAQVINQKRATTIDIPSESTKSTFRRLVLLRTEAARTLLRVDYAKPGYGGDTYYVPLGRFLAEEKR